MMASGAVPSCTAYDGFSGLGTFRCSGIDCPKANGAVWCDIESMMFSADSSPCRSARAAGILPHGSGGVYTLVPAEGRAEYTGGTINGIEVRSWSRGHPRSFRVVAAASSSLSAPVTGNNQIGIAPTSSAGGDATCMMYAKDACSGVFRCVGRSCPRAGRPVWGTQDGGPGQQQAQLVFTGDSSPCGAAIAAGVISSEGGSYMLVPVGARFSLTGAQNAAGGITVRPWPAYERCFIVVSPDSMARNGSGAGMADAAAAAAGAANQQQRDYREQTGKNRSKAAATSSKKPARLFFAFEGDPIVG